MQRLPLIWIYYSITLFLLCVAGNIHAQPPHSFTQAKKIMQILFQPHAITLYCGCSYNKHKQVDLKSCHMQAAQAIKRAHRIEAEHMMPAENFGRQLSCWRKPLCIRKNGKHYKGRSCCRKISQRFRAMEDELYNIWPAVGLVNQARSNFRYHQLYSNKQLLPIFYGCHFAVNKMEHAVEPRNAVKGIVARANLFMAQHYDIDLSKSQRQLFNTWNKQYPPSHWEKQWAKQVAKVEGYTNSYIIDFANKQVV